MSFLNKSFNKAGFNNLKWMTLESQHIIKVQNLL